ncbi:hypothetical protein J6590_012653 [Homalodisca vitripennis]|nr:hypothetical protein J6590_012653 [Homalodisca vitripennis]
MATNTPGARRLEVATEHWLPLLISNGIVPTGLSERKMSALTDYDNFVMYETSMSVRSTRVVSHARLKSTKHGTPPIAQSVRRVALRSVTEERMRHTLHAPISYQPPRMRRAIRL